MFCITLAYAAKAATDRLHVVRTSGVYLTHPNLPYVQMPHPRNQLRIYTDGSCSKPHTAGGHAAVFSVNGKFRGRVVGNAAKTTNNRMEMQAALSALKSVEAGVYDDIVVFTDSKYLQRGMRHFVWDWIDCDHLTGPDSDIPNADLWWALVTEHWRLRPRWCWVRGHAGNAYNELADKLAKQERLKLSK